MSRSSWTATVDGPVSRGLPRPAGHRASVKVGAPGGRGVRTAQGPLPDAVRLQQRELAQAARRGRHAHESVPRRAGRARSANLHRNSVRLRFIGDRDEPGQRAQASAWRTRRRSPTAIRARTAGGGRLWRPLGHRPGLPLARGATRRPAFCAPSEIGEAQVAARLALGGMPDPDLLIRTGGEQRISNFLLWNLAYTELYFTDVLWPEFSAGASRCGLRILRRRERRFGKTSAQVAAQSPMLKLRILTAVVLDRHAAAWRCSCSRRVDGARLRRSSTMRRLGMGAASAACTAAARDWRMRCADRACCCCCRLAVDRRSGHLAGSCCARPASGGSSPSCGWCSRRTRHQPRARAAVRRAGAGAGVRRARAAAARGTAPSRGPQLVLWLLLLVFAADIGAFFAGRNFGRLNWRRA